MTKLYFQSHPWFRKPDLTAFWSEECGREWFTIHFLTASGKILYADCSSPPARQMQRTCWRILRSQTVAEVPVERAWLSGWLQESCNPPLTHVRLRWDAKSFAWSCWAWGLFVRSATLMPLLIGFYAPFYLERLLTFTNAFSSAISITIIFLHQFAGVMNHSDRFFL